MYFYFRNENLFSFGEEKTNQTSSYRIPSEDTLLQEECFTNKSVSNSSSFSTIVHKADENFQFSSKQFVNTIELSSHKATISSSTFFEIVKKSDAKCQLIPITNVSEEDTSSNKPTTTSPNFLDIVNKKDEKTMCAKTGRRNRTCAGDGEESNSNNNDESIKEEISPEPQRRSSRRSCQKRKRSHGDDDDDKGDENKMSERVKHPSAHRMRCGFCPLSFRSWVSLKKHMIEEHGECVPNDKSAKRVVKYIKTKDYDSHESLVQSCTPVFPPLNNLLNDTTSESSQSNNESPTESDGDTSTDEDVDRLMIVKEGKMALDDYSIQYCIDSENKIWFKAKDISSMWYKGSGGSKLNKLLQGKQLESFGMSIQDGIGIYYSGIGVSGGSGKSGVQAVKAFNLETATAIILKSNSRHGNYVSFMLALRELIGKEVESVDPMKLFKQMNLEEQQEFITALYNDGIKDIKNLFRNLSKDGKKRKSFAESSDLTQKLKTHEVIETMKRCFSHFQEIPNEHYKFENMDVDPTVVEASQYEIEQIVNSIEFDESIKQGATAMLHQLRELYVDILKSHDCKQIIQGALFGTVDIEQIMECNFTAIKMELSISDKEWDRVVFPLLKLLNKLLGLNVIFSGQYYRLKFNQFCDQYVIYNSEKDGIACSRFSLIQSLDKEFSNLQHRSQMRWLKLENEDIYICPQIYGCDAINIPGSSTHRKFTNGQRFNMSSPWVSQMSKHWKMEILYSSDDKFVHQNLFLKPQYEEWEDLEANYQDPLSGEKLHPLLNFVTDTPAIRAHIGASESELGSYSYVWADVKLDELKSETRLPSKIIVPIGKDKKGGNAQFLKNQESIKDENKRNDAKCRQASATSLKNSQKNPWIGTCSLYISNRMHLAFKPASRLLSYLAMSIMQLHPNKTLMDINDELCRLCKIPVQILFTGKHGSTKPSTRLRGADVTRFLKCGLQILEKYFLDANNNLLINITYYNGLKEMFSCLQKIDNLLSETSVPDEKTLIFNSESLRHNVVKFTELGMKLFEVNFLTWSLVMLYSVAPMWYVYGHRIGHGWNSVAEDALEHSHQDVIRMDRATSRQATGKIKPYKKTQKIIRHKRFLQDIREMRTETSIANDILKSKKKRENGRLIKVVKHDYTEQKNRKQVPKIQNAPASEDFKNIFTVVCGTKTLQHFDDEQSEHEIMTRARSKKPEVVEPTEVVTNNMEVEYESDSESEDSENTTTNLPEEFKKRFEARDFISALYIICNNKLSNETHDRLFAKIQIVIPAGKFAKIELKIDTSVGNFTVRIPYINVRLVKSLSEISFPSHVKKVNKRSKKNINIQANKDETLVVIDLLEFASFKTSKKGQVKLNELRNLFTTTSTFILQIPKNSSAAFMKILKQHLDVRNLSSAYKGTDFKFSRNLLEFKQRVNTCNITKLAFLRLPNNARLIRDIKRLMSKKKVGSFGKPQCYLCKKKNVIPWLHGACRKVVDSQGICCGLPKHKYFWSILAGEIKLVEDPIKNFQYSDEILQVKNSILNCLFVRPGGVKLAEFMYYFKDNFATDKKNTILKSLAPYVLYDPVANTFLHYKFSILYNRKVKKLSFEEIINLCAQQESVKMETSHVNNHMKAHENLRRGVRKRKRSEAFKGKDEICSKKKKTSFGKFFKELIDRRCLNSSTPFTRKDYVVISRITARSQQQVKKYLHNHYPGLLENLSRNRSQKTSLFSDLFIYRKKKLGCGINCGGPQEVKSLCRNCGTYYWHNSCVQNFYKRMQINSNTDIYESGWKCPVCKYGHSLFE